jgi:hypothetical protein
MNEQRPIGWHFLDKDLQTPPARLPQNENHHDEARARAKRGNARTGQSRAEIMASTPGDSFVTRESSSRIAYSRWPDAFLATTGDFCAPHAQRRSVCGAASLPTKVSFSTSWP